MIDLTKFLKNVRIEDVIEDYIPIHKHGNLFLALCPFHDDTDPSLNIVVKKQIYKCFACGAGGNAVTFVQKMEPKLSFEEAIEFIAKKKNIDLKNLNINLHDHKIEKEKISPNKAIALEINQEANKLYQYLLNGSTLSKEAKEYLLSRKITPEIIAKNQLGFSGDPETAKKLFLAKGYTPDQLTKSGLVWSKEATPDNVNVLFNNRIMIPLFNESSEIVGFTSRKLNAANQKEDKMRYMLSATTDSFQRSKYLYNINNAKEFIQKEGYVFVVEGVMDVFALQKNGIENVISPMGTNLSEEQVHDILKLSKNIILAFDSDDAGKAAYAKYSQQMKALNHTARVFACNLKLGKDLDEFFNEKNGSKELLFRTICETNKFSEKLATSLANEKQAILNQNKGINHESK